MRFSVEVRGHAAPAGVVAEDMQSHPHVTGPPETEPEIRVCQSLTKAGNPCQGTPGDDGLCAAHKPKEGDDAEPVPAPVDADQAQASTPGEA